MKQCGYCGRKNGDEAINCRECGTLFEGMAPPQPLASAAAKPRCGKIFIGICGLIIIAVLAANLVISSPGAAKVAVSFAGYSTNAAGLRVAEFDVVSGNDYGLRYLAACVPGWSNLVQGGNFPAHSKQRIEARAPAGVRYRFMFAYCRHHGEVMDRVHRLWCRWLGRWLPSKRLPVPFEEPGFGSLTILGPEVGP